MKKIEDKLNIDLTTFIPAVTISVVLLGIIIYNPDTSREVTKSILSYLTTNLGWLYTLVYVACFGFFIYLLFSKLGNIKLGGDDEEPEFSYFSWVAMIFAAGVGIGLMLFGFLEPIMYLNDPPFSIIPHSNDAYEWAHMYGQFHWGISAWSFYIPITLPIAYYIHSKKMDTTKISDISRYAMNKHFKGRIMSIIDILIIFGILGGIGTSLGLAVPLISNIAGDLFGIPDNWYLKIAIVSIWVLMFGCSVFRGLDKGIKIFSNVNIVIAVLFAIFVFIIGPGQFILNLEINSIGLYCQNLIRMSFWSDPIANTGFTERWTYFYWGWWLSYAAMMGLFVARISKGRTLKQVATGMIIWGALGSCFFFAIFGGYSIYLEKAGIINITNILNKFGREAAIVAILKTMPFSKIVLFVYGITCFIFLSTTIDSAAYVLASVCTKKLKSDEEPQRWNRLLWAFIFGAVAIALVMLGGIEAAQASAIIGGTPIIIVYVILGFSFRKMLKEDGAILENNNAKNTLNDHKNIFIRKT